MTMSSLRPQRSLSLFQWRQALPRVLADFILVHLAFLASLVLSSSLRIGNHRQLARRELASSVESVSACFPAAVVHLPGRIPVQRLLQQISSLYGALQVEDSPVRFRHRLADVFCGAFPLHRRGSAT